MAGRFDFAKKLDIAWCPGCGDFSIRTALLAALEDLDLPQKDLVMVSGIGQAAKMPQYVNSSFFNGLHGRALPVATAIKAVAPDLTVVAEGGDGDMYGEGGNHFLHAARRNPDLTLLVHDNMVYGLTKGQAAPTTREGMATPVQVFGVTAQHLNPLALAIGMNIGFVARAFSGDIEGTTDIIEKAIAHKGFSLVDIFQPCVSFNKVNTYQWFKANTYTLDPSYDPRDRAGAFAKALEEAPYPLGILYQDDSRPAFEESLHVYAGSRQALRDRRHSRDSLLAAIQARR